MEVRKKELDYKYSNLIKFYLINKIIRIKLYIERFLE
jgi:hypothetical protein